MGYRPSIPPEEVGRRGREIYEARLRAQVEPAETGKYMVINVESGEYVIDPDETQASRRALTLFPNSPRYALRVGTPSTHRLGSKVQQRP